MMGRPVVQLPVDDLLTTEQVRWLLHLRSERDVNRLVTGKQLLALHTDGGADEYPAFQFTDLGRVRPELPALLRILGDVVETPETIVSWLTSPKTYLNDESPIEWIQRGNDPEPVMVGAEQTAARLAS